VAAVVVVVAAAAVRDAAEQFHVELSAEGTCRRLYQILAESEVCWKDVSP